MKETFKSDLEGIRNFLSEKRKLTDLAKRAGVSIRLVHQALSVSKFEELTGDKLTVYQEAITFVEEIKNLPAKAKEVVKA